MITPNIRNTAHPNMCIYSHTTLTRSQFRSAYAVDCTFRIMRMLVTTHDNAKSTQYHPYIYAIQPIPNYMCACTLTTTLTILSQVPDVCRHRMPGLPLCMTAAREPAVLLARKYDRHSRALPSRRRSLLRPSIARLRPAILMRCQPSLRAGTSRLLPDEVLIFEAFTAPVPERAKASNLGADMARHEVHVDRVKCLGRHLCAVLGSPSPLSPPQVRPQAALKILTQGQALRWLRPGWRWGGTPLGLWGYLPPLDDHDGVWPAREPFTAPPHCVPPTCLAIALTVPCVPCFPLKARVDRLDAGPSCPLATATAAPPAAGPPSPRRRLRVPRFD